jgi:hypothetical protein
VEVEGIKKNQQRKGPHYKWMMLVMQRIEKGTRESRMETRRKIEVKA